MKITNKMIELRLEIALEHISQNIYYIINTGTGVDAEIFRKFKATIEEEIGETLTKESAFLGFSTMFMKHSSVIMKNEPLNKEKYININNYLNTINDLVLEYCINDIKDNIEKSKKIQNILKHIKNIKRIFGVSFYVEYLRLFFNYEINDVALSTIRRNIFIMYLFTSEPKDIVGFDDKTNKIIYHQEYNEGFLIITLQSDDKVWKFTSTTYWLCTMITACNGNFRDITRRILCTNKSIRTGLLDTVRKEIEKEEPKVFEAMQMEAEYNKQYMAELAMSLCSERYHLTIIPQLYINRETLENTEIYQSPDLNRNIEIEDPMLSTILGLMSMTSGVLTNREFVIPKNGMKVILREDRKQDFKEMFLKEYHIEEDDIHKLIVSYKHSELRRTLVLDIKNIKTMLYSVTTEVDVIAMMHVFKILGIYDDLKEIVEDSESLSKILNEVNMNKNKIGLEDVQKVLKEGMKEMDDKMLGDYRYEEPYSWNFSKSNKSLNKVKDTGGIRVEKIIEIDRYTRKLPTGQEASQDALEYAKKYAINLEGKTIVRPFLRKATMKLK